MKLLTQIKHRWHLVVGITSGTSGTLFGSLEGADSAGAYRADSPVTGHARKIRQSGIVGAVRIDGSPRRNRPSRFGSGFPSVSFAAGGSGQPSPVLAKETFQSQTSLWWMLPWLVVAMMLLWGVGPAQAQSGEPAPTDTIGGFTVECGPPHLSEVFDPIVFPGERQGHMHEFYGSRAIGPSSTPSELIGTRTTCADEADPSSYWHPTVYVDGERVPATSSTMYYTQRNRMKPTLDMTEWPAGLRVVAGNRLDTTDPGDEPVYWGCGNGSANPKEAHVPQCVPGDSGGLQVHVIFPDCWDGKNLDSPDHRSHMSYSSRDQHGVYRCDASHPVSLPFLIMRYTWHDLYPSPNQVTLSSGAPSTFHADFMNGWEQDRLRFLVDHCIKGGIECRRVETDDPPGRLSEPLSGFQDTAGSVFESDIEWIAERGITYGCNPARTRYCPDRPVLRGEMAAFLNRSLDLPAGRGDSFFDDDDSLFEDDLEALARAGIARGCNPPSNDRICPDQAITRGQMAAFLVRAFDLGKEGEPQQFDDVAGVFEGDIATLSSNDITRGCGEHRFCPDEVVTRGQMAAFLRRALTSADN